MPTENRSSNTEMVSVPRALAERISNICMFTMYKEDWRALSEILAQPAEQLQGEPVPITSDMHRLMEAYRLGEFTAEGGSNTIESLAVESFDAVANHGHDADSYMAGFCASLYWQAAPFIGLALKPVTHADPAEVERLRAQVDTLAEWCGNALNKLADRDALLREALPAVEGCGSQRFLPTFAQEQK
ncbi:hypothetical protein [Pseudomonas sp. HTZ2]|uniref:hypothetical protein n=1 Tax=Pseudomonas sp. HTZ2 TaxID=3075220 RepID=UPI00295863CE|nr:hypothetical protein [Pseudomonas sp. HTZ2]